MKELRLRVKEEADLAILAGSISRLLVAAQAPDEERIRILTAAMELARNIIKYATEGEVRFGCERRDTAVNCWIEAEDQGPGIADVEQALADHFSTGKTLGLGLPGVRRLMDRTEIRSFPGAGTHVRADRSFVASGSAPRVKLAWAGLPSLGNRVSGDLVMIEEGGGTPSAVVVDVAGHGAEAYAAAERIRLSQPLAAPLADVSVAVQRIHDRLVGSGAAAAVMAVRVRSNDGLPLLEYCGVGNVRIAFSRGASRDEGHPGMAGHQLPSLRVKRIALDPRCLVAVFTDGVAATLNLGPELEVSSLPHLPSLLLRRHGGRHDDATCLVLRLGAH